PAFPCRADQGLPHPAQGPRSRGGGRAGDPDAQGEARPDVRALQVAGRGDVRRPRGEACGRDGARGTGLGRNGQSWHHNWHHRNREETMLRKLAAALAMAAAPAFAQDAYTIGLTGALTGPPASTYAPAIEALRIYLERVNARGGVNGKRV